MMATKLHNMKHPQASWTNWMIISTQNLQEECIKEMKVKRTNNLHNLLIATELHTYEESVIS